MFHGPAECVSCQKAGRTQHLTPDPTGLQFKPGDPYATIPIGSGLKFYNLHQTLNTSINVLKSFTDIYLILSARSGFVFFISFTSFFLTLICLHHILSGMSCQACCLVLGACCLGQVFDLLHSVK
jgi:hypothetical protein